MTSAEGYRDLLNSVHTERELCEISAEVAKMSISFFNLAEDLCHINQSLTIPLTSGD